MILTVTFWKRQNYGDRAKGSVVSRGRRGGRDEQLEHRGFGGRETTLYDSVMVDTCHYVFVKTHRLYNTKSDPSV